MLSIRSTATLHNGVEIPLLGFGTYKLDDGDEACDCVAHALRTGYRHVDTAAVYDNEQGVGDGIRDSGVPREELFVTTKCWNDDIRGGTDAVLRAFDASLSRLGLDRVDLYLLHWPIDGQSLEAWRALERIYHDGRARAIGVSNFLQHHLEALLPKCEVPPMVDQVEHHPRLTQPTLHQYLREQNIISEAWSPLMQGDAMSIPELKRIADAHGKSPAQVTLRWQLQHGIVTIPKSSHEGRIEENADLFDFELTDAEMAAIDALDENKRVGPDPDDFDF